ncbi:hydroxymethylglutaryl-CoA lyase [Ferruginibacter sp.]|nr:hydroxymethylglutaryl-CoA lyase [Ferruginibacter sp.]
MQQKFKLIECPRDAMQGWKHFIPTQKKIEYINALLKVGFDTIDFGSFVSPKAIPQMADTRDVIGNLELGNTGSKLLAIVANERGATDAVVYDEITYLGFPFSVSETFQKRNTNSTIEESLNRVEEIQNLCIKNTKQLVVYISMGFGNPYGDEYNEAIVFNWVDKLVAMDIKIISLADTVGLATAAQVKSVTKHLVDSLPDIEIGVHLHSTAINWKDKVDAALHAGCKRFDGALKGIGGCPMANNELVGNMDTELMIPYFEKLNLLDHLDKEALQHCSQLATSIFV